MLVFDQNHRLADEEVADYMVLYGDKDPATGEQVILKTIVYYYVGGKRAKDANYRDCLEMASTYYGDPDKNKDGVLSDEELKSARKISMFVYDDTHRNAGEEVADYTENIKLSHAITDRQLY